MELLGEFEKEARNTITSVKSFRYQTKKGRPFTIGINSCTYNLRLFGEITFYPHLIRIIRKRHGNSFVTLKDVTGGISLASLFDPDYPIF